MPDWPGRWMMSYRSRGGGEFSIFAGGRGGGRGTRSMLAEWAKSV